MQIIYFRTFVMILYIIFIEQSHRIVCDSYIFNAIVWKSFTRNFLRCKRLQKHYFFWNCDFWDGPTFLRLLGNCLLKQCNSTANLSLFRLRVITHNGYELQFSNNFNLSEVSFKGPPQRILVTEVHKSAAIVPRLQRTVTVRVTPLAAARCWWGVTTAY